MTAYFDQFETDVRKAADWDGLYALDKKIVRDISIAVMMPAVPARGGVEARPACPEKFATAAHRLILRYSLSVYETTTTIEKAYPSSRGTCTRSFTSWLTATTGRMGTARCRRLDALRPMRSRRAMTS